MMTFFVTFACKCSFLVFFSFFSFFFTILFIFFIFSSQFYFIFHLRIIQWNFKNFLFQIFIGNMSNSYKTSWLRTWHQRYKVAFVHYHVLVQYESNDLPRPRRSALSECFEFSFCCSCASACMKFQRQHVDIISIQAPWSSNRKPNRNQMAASRFPLVTCWFFFPISKVMPDKAFKCPMPVHKGAQMCLACAHHTQTIFQYPGCTPQFHLRLFLQ